MANKPEIQYIRYYTDGSAARKPEIKVALPKKTAPKKKKAVVRKICIDPIAVIGLVVSCVLLLCMATSFTELMEVRAQQQQLQSYVDTLREEKDELEETYRDGYTLKEIEQMALAMGMVPHQEVQHITVHLPEREPVAEPTFWQQVTHFLTSLFA